MTKSDQKEAEKIAGAFRQAAAEGNANAQYNLGVLHNLGEGVRQSSEEAAWWYRKAAEKGHAGA